MTYQTAEKLPDFTEALDATRSIDTIRVMFTENDISIEARARRLREARARKYRSAQKAAEALGFNPVTVRAHENAQNGFPVEIAAAYASTYGVSMDWLLTGRGDALPKPLAAQVREEREHRGWSQAELARRVGTTQQTVDRLERGQTAFSRATAPILEALGIEVGAAPPAPALPKAPVSLTQLADGKARLTLDLTMPFSVALQILSIVQEAQVSSHDGA